MLSFAEAEYEYCVCIIMLRQKEKGEEDDFSQIDKAFIP
jgi:hypothetical protein